MHCVPIRTNMVSLCQTGSETAKNRFSYDMACVSFQVNTQNSDGNSPLHIVCQADHEQRVHIMLKLLQV